MIKGLGNDIIEVERIAVAIERHGDRFLERCFSAREIAYCQRHHDATRRFAGRWAAKEAVVKAFGTGFDQGIGWQDIEIINDSHGKPEVVLSTILRERFHDPIVLVTISHCKAYATATAIWAI